MGKLSVTIVPEEEKNFALSAAVPEEVELVFIVAVPDIMTTVSDVFIVRVQGMMNASVVWAGGIRSASHVMVMEHGIVMSAMEKGNLSAMNVKGKVI